MRTNHSITLFSLFILLLALVTPHADAWTLFGSKNDALTDRLRSGDKLMLKADSAYEAGKMSRASGYYARAIKKYEALNEADPGFMDGIAAIRIAYCARQYTNALEAVSATEAEAAEKEKADETTDVKEGPDGEDRSESTAQDTLADKGQKETGTGESVAEPQTKPIADSVANAVAEAVTDKAAVNQKADSPSEEGPDKKELESPPAPPPRPAYDPRNFTHDFAEARMLMEDGNYSEAAAVLIPMLRHDPSNRQVRLLIAIVRTRQGRYDEAIVALEDLRGIREDLPILLALSGAYMGVSRYHDALLALDSAIRINPADPNAYMNLAWLTLVMPAEADTLKNAEIYYRQAILHGAARDRSLEARLGLKKW